MSEPSKHSIALLKAQNYGAWLPVSSRGAAAGRLGPYSVDELGHHGFELLYSDATFSPPWSRMPVERVLEKAGRMRPELRGLRNVLANRALIRRAELTLGIFEDQASFAAFARARALPALAPRRMALISCWLAEWARDADERTLRAYRRVLAGTDLLICFSRNQTSTFESLGVPEDRLLSVPFGIDTAFFDRAPHRDGEYVLAVGADTSRDHELLVEAVAGTSIPTRIYAPRLAVAELPANVTWVAERLDHVTYRDVLASAAAVVVPTNAPRYPGGQTVILEAMACGTPVITTASPAIGEYVRDAVNGILVPRGDAGALRGAIERLLDDRQLAARLAGQGRSDVAGMHSQQAMWATIGRRLRALVQPAAAAAGLDPDKANAAAAPRTGGQA